MRYYEIVKAQDVSNNEYINPYIVIDHDAKIILSDAQGYGYKTEESAEKGFEFWNGSNEEGIIYEKWMKGEN